MCIGCDGATIVEADDFDILAAGLGDCPQDVAADTAKAIERDTDCHLFVSFNDACCNGVCHPRDMPLSRGFYRGRRPVRPDGSGLYGLLGRPFSGQAQPPWPAAPTCASMPNVQGLGRFHEELQAQSLTQRNSLAAHKKF